MTALFPVSPLERVREGMTVVDAHDRRVGRVANVFPGYPDAISTNEDDLKTGLVGLIIAPLENTGGTSAVGVGIPFIVDNLLDDGSVSDEPRLELLRSGFIELDAPDLRGPARYVHADQIREVLGDTVSLKTVPHTIPTAPKPSASPRITLGATVRTADDHQIGKIDRLIVDPYTLSIRALVIRKGLLVGHAVEIPLVAIQDSTDDELRLRYSADQVKRMPEFVDARYAAPPTGFVPPVAYTRESLLWPIGVPLLPPPPPSRNETAVRWTGNNAELVKGSDVVARDGTKIGEVNAISLDPTTRRPIGLVVRRGFLFEQEVEFPIEAIREVGRGVVYLDMDSQQANAYPQGRPTRRPAWSQTA